MGFGAAENAEDIVLRSGQAMGLEELLGFEAQGIGGLLEGDEDGVLQGNSMGGRAATHGITIVVMTTNVKRK
jgi:hypothetical protein